MHQWYVRYCYVYFHMLYNPHHNFMRTYIISPVTHLEHNILPVELTQDHTSSPGL